MIDKIKFQKASKNDITLYTSLGESICALQVLEDALSHAIVLKKTEPHQKKEADDLMQKQRFYTFGKAIKVAKKESLLSEKIQAELSNLLEERNWLVHDCITDDKENYKSESFYNRLFERTKVITQKAKKLQVSIELDLIEYSQKKGIDVTEVKNKMKENYGIN